MPQSMEFGPQHLEYLKGPLKLHRIPDQKTGQSLENYVSSLDESSRYALILLINLHQFVNRGQSHDYAAQSAKIEQDITRKSQTFGKYIRTSAAALEQLVKEGRIDYWLYISQAGKGIEGALDRTLDGQGVDIFTYSSREGGKLLQFGTAENDVDQKKRELEHFYRDHMKVNNIIGVLGVRDIAGDLKDVNTLARNISETLYKTTAIITPPKRGLFQW